MAVVVARITAFGDGDPRRRADTPGELEVLATHLEIRRRLQRDGAPLVLCGVFLGVPERAQLAHDLVLSIPAGFLTAQLGIDDGAAQLIRLLRRLVEASR